MKNYLGLIFLIFILIIPVSFATDENITASTYTLEENQVDEICVNVLNDSQVNVTGTNDSYENNNGVIVMPVGQVTINNLTKYYNEDTPLSSGLNGMVIGTHTLVYKLTRISTGESKTYVRNLSNLSLEINLAPGTYGVQYYLGLNLGDNAFSETVAWIKIKTPNINKTETSLTYNDPSKKDIFQNNLTGQFKTIDGKGLSNKTITINITRLRTGLSKEYNVTTDECGNFLLEINLNPNFKYKFEAYYVGDEGLEKSKAVYYNIVETLFTNVNFTGDSYVGQLKTKYNESLTNHEVKIKVKRVISDNNLINEKVYTVLSDGNGEFSLPINLYSGIYWVGLIYEGASEYGTSGKSNVISI